MRRSLDRVLRLLALLFAVLIQVHHGNFLIKINHARRHEVYLVDEAKMKHLIMGMDTLTGLGYDLADIKLVSEQEVGAFPDGDDLNIGGMSAADQEKYNKHSASHKTHSVYKHAHHGNEHYYVNSTLLVNENVAAFTFSSGIRDLALLMERILPASRTWLRSFKLGFVILEDTFVLRFAFRHCTVLPHRLYQVYRCPHEHVTYVLTECNNCYFGYGGPCCKFDAMVKFITHDDSDQFAAVKYVLHADDDTYWRPSQVIRWLDAVEASGVSDKFPIVANRWKFDEMRTTPSEIRGCDEVQMHGFYQPTMFNRAFLEKMKVLSTPTSSYPMVDICKEFDLTHDQALGIYAWLLEAYHMYIPGSADLERESIRSLLRPDLLQLHHITPEAWSCKGYITSHHTQDQEEISHNNESHAYQKDSTLIGCGDIDKAMPGHDTLKTLNAYDIFEYFRDHGTDLDFLNERNEWFRRAVAINSSGKVEYILSEDVEKTVVVGADGRKKYKGLDVVHRLVPHLEMFTGYKSTKHAQIYNLSKEWTPFRGSDCAVPATFPEWHKRQDYWLKTVYVCDVADAGLPSQLGSN